MEPLNLTAKLPLQLMFIDSKKNTKQIHHIRLSFLLQFFSDKTSNINNW